MITEESVKISGAWIRRLGWWRLEEGFSSVFGLLIDMEVKLTFSPWRLSSWVILSNFKPFLHVLGYYALEFLLGSWMISRIFRICKFYWFPKTSIFSSRCCNLYIHGLFENIISIWLSRNHWIWVLAFHVISRW